MMNNEKWRDTGEQLTLLIQNLISAIEKRGRYIEAAEAVFKSVDLTWDFEPTEDAADDLWIKLQTARKGLKLDGKESDDG